MSFVYEPIGRVRAMTRMVSYSTRSVGRRGGPSRHALLFGAGVIEAMGWRHGMKIAAGYGAPSSEDAGWMEIKPSEVGVMLRTSGPRSLKAEIHTYPDFVTDRPHPVEHCAIWKRVGDALRVKLPDWVCKPYTAERGDRPHAGKPKTGEPDNSSHAEAGGGDSSGSTDAPPAAIPAHVNGAMNGTTLKGEMADHTGGEEAATVAPPVREPAAPSSGRRRVIYEAIKRAAECGEATPTLISLSRLIGSEDPSIADYHVKALHNVGVIRREGVQASLAYHVVEIDKSTVSRALRRAAVAPKPAKPIADTHGGVAPIVPATPAGAITMKSIIAWLNDMGMTCADTGGGMYLMGDRYVEAQDVIDRANRKRRIRNEPEFTVA